MLTYSLDGRNGESLYSYLYKCIRNDILTGVLKPGSRLPSKRSFADHLGVSVVTIENAYSQLQSEGFLYSVPKRGFYVSYIQTTRPKLNSDQNQCSQSFYSPPSYTPPTESNIRINLFSNRIAAENFPFSIWAKLMRETLSQNQNALMEPSPSAGIPELRQAIAKHLYDFRSMEVKADQIIIGAGTEYLYSLLIQLLGYDKTYAVEFPGYQKLTHIYECHKTTCVNIPIDEAGIIISRLNAAKADVVHLSPSHHYPTGIVTPISRRYELLAWANQAPMRYIIEDDYDSEFRLSGKPIPTLQGIDSSECVIYMNTFTKTLSPTIRISYMVLPDHLLKKFNNNMGFYSCTVSNFEQYTLAKFVDQGHFERHINRMRTHYRQIRDRFIAAIKESPLRNRVQISNADSGLHFLLKVKTSISDEALLHRAEAHGLGILCLSQFNHKDLVCPQNILIISYAGLNSEEIPMAVQLLTECLE